MDNVFTGRLWRSVKHEGIYLWEYPALRALEAGLSQWFTRYNTWRPHEAPGNATPPVFYEAAPAMARQTPGSQAAQAA